MASKAASIWKMVIVTLLFCLLPFTAEAGLIRIYFNLHMNDTFNTVITGSPFIEIEDSIEYGELYYDARSMPGFRFEWETTWTDLANERSVYSTGVEPEEISSPFTLQIDDLGGNVFVAQLGSFRWTDLNPIFIGGIPFSLMDHRCFDDGTYMFLENGVWDHYGTYTTEVWFDDPPPEVPIPAPGVLLLSALLPIVGIKKWRRT